VDGRVELEEGTGLVRIDPFKEVERKALPYRLKHSLSYGKYFPLSFQEG
jgi:hypothetical protein